LTEKKSKSKSKVKTPKKIIPKETALAAPEGALIKAYSAKKKKELTTRKLTQKETKALAISERLAHEGFDVIGETLSLFKDLKRQAKKDKSNKSLLKQQQEILFKLLDMNFARPRPVDQRMSSDRIQFNIQIPSATPAGSPKVTTIDVNKKEIGIENKNE